MLHSLGDEEEQTLRKLKYLEKWKFCNEWIETRHKQHLRLFQTHVFHESEEILLKPDERPKN